MQARHSAAVRVVPFERHCERRKASHMIRKDWRKRRNPSKIFAGQSEREQSSSCYPGAQKHELSNARPYWQ